uniref:Myomesin 3 n=1 Tax=Oryzias melastigma TaxID=30732 RepID=A0A3B3CM22_ORYME
MPLFTLLAYSSSQPQANISIKKNYKVVQFEPDDGSDKKKEDHHRESWTMFGNEVEKVELDVIRNQQMLRTRVDKMDLRRKVFAAQHMTYLERLSQRSPDFPVPLRAHMVWEGMTVKLSCTVQGCPPPKVTWCSPDDAGSVERQVGIGPHQTSAPTSPKSPICLISSYLIHTFPLKSECLSSLLALELQPEAQFDSTFSPTWAKEGTSFTLQCTFTNPLLPFQQDVSWFRDGVQLHQSSSTDITTCDNKATITIGTAHKEYEGFYTAKLRTRDGVQEHKSFVYIKDASAAALGGPASPLAVQVSDVNRDYIFLTWQPPSADGASPVEGYIGQDEWVRCNVHIQKACHFPVFGLKDRTLYRFRVRAVNQAGAGRPSKATEDVLTGDPLEHTRTTGMLSTLSTFVPLPPTDVHACEVSDSYVVLRWTEPEPRGREPLTFYVEQSLAGQTSWGLASMDVVVSSPRFPVFGLVKEKQYCFRVRSVNKYGVSDPSEPSAPVSLAKPQAVPAPPPSVMAVRDTDTSVLLQWEEPTDKNGILGYYLYYSEAGKQDWKTVNNKPVVKTRFTVHGLKTRREYVFRVKSVSRAGNSRYSDESRPIMVKSAINVPSAPSAISLLLCSGSEMVLGWRAPSCHGGSPVQGYYLDQREKGTETWREVNVKPAKKRQFKVSNLICGHFYHFRVFAANLAGVGKPSDASEAFLCEKWTMPQPGCPYDLEFREVRNGSLVLLWAAPLYEGRGPVIGYLLEISQGDESESWTPLNKKPISDTHYKVTGLQAGETYRLRVSAVNECGVGRASLPSEAVTVRTRPDIEIGVDDDGFIFLGYEASEMNSESEFLWSRNYSDPIDAKRTKTETKNNRDPSVEDLGLYTVEMSDNPHLSSSYDFTAEVIALKSGWEVEVSEKGSVRLWLQTESLSDAAELRLICNDHEISSTPHRKINFDKAKGLVEILFDQLSREDKGSYTAQLRDGRAKNQFTLLLVDQSESYSCRLHYGSQSSISSSDKVANKTRSGCSENKSSLKLHDRPSVRLIIFCFSQSLCLTCFIDGEPAPEIFWLRNDREILDQTQFTITKEPKRSSITVNKVHMEDSGKYSIFVRNQHGSETVDVTVSVYRHGEKPPIFQLKKKYHI